MVSHAQPLGIVNKVCCDLGAWRAHVRFGPVFAAALAAQLGVVTMLSLTAEVVGIELDYAFGLVAVPRQGGVRRLGPRRVTVNLVMGGLALVPTCLM